MDTLQQIRERILGRFPGADVAFVANPGPSGQHSLLLPPSLAREIATFLRDAPGLRLDYCSNVSGVDWPDREFVETTTVTLPNPATGAPTEYERTTKQVRPGYLEVVYHLYSMELKHGPVVVRMRTGNRRDQVTLPSLTPVWRACDFQEREVFDLYGVVFAGHPNLRRILMWDEFKDHPMRKDYVAPDDFEWEPTPHGEVLARAKAHYPAPKPATTEGGPA
jgi:NADH-quinone oxidoreductase subunit C